MTEELRQFSPNTARWFEACVGKPTPVQLAGWPAIASGGHALLSAPTGTGKTLAAFLVFLDQLGKLHEAGALEEQLYVLYISPLKALGNDIRENLNRPLEGVPFARVRAAVRTGDTDQAQRRQMIKHPPHILITTPESLFLLLTSGSGQSLLKTAKTVIIDELHALIDTKRGAHLMLSLARLDALCAAPLQRVALSATIRPLERAARFLAGDAPAQIIAPQGTKRMGIRVKSVLSDMRVLPEHTIWPELARAVHDECRDARTVIAFVEGRAQAEKLAHYVNAIAGAGFALTHHGCVSKEQRLLAERALKHGELRLLCATSSMELGIDVGEVDKVVQIGCPLTVSSALQRLGRAGHAPGRSSEMRIFPRMVGEFTACALTATAALEGMIEPASPSENCLDIVSQHLVSMAASADYTVDELTSIVRSAHSFRNITRADIENVLRMLAGDYEHALDRPARPRLIYDRIHGTVSGDGYSRMLALSSGGTIPDRGWFPVVMEDGTRLGELDEEFVFEARIGDKFLLGAFAWRIISIGRDRVTVSSANTEGAQVPFWKGDGHGRAYHVALEFGRMMRSVNEAFALGRLPARLAALHMDESAAANAARHLARQIEATGCLPSDQTIIVEHFSDDAGEHQAMVHSVFGRRVNMALELLLVHEAERVTGLDVKHYSDDDGLLLYLMGAREVPRNLIETLDPDRAPAIIRALLPKTPLFTMCFRYNAARALMMGANRGARVPLWVQRLRGAEALEGAAHDFAHPLMRETLRECMEDYLDLAALREVLLNIRAGAISVIELDSPVPSPMALPLRRQAEATLMYEYSPMPKSALQASEDALKAAIAIPPDPLLLEDAAARKAPPRDAERLHASLMEGGDMLSEELASPAEWIQSLAAEGRALYIDPGLWIAAEQEALYRAALEEGDGEALSRVVRRCLLFRTPLTPDALVERYQVDDQRAGETLAALAQAGAAVKDGEVYHHHAVYLKAQRQTVALRRREAVTQGGARFAHMLALSTRTGAGAAEQLRRALEDLSGAPFPLSMWEDVLLPGRVDAYRPKLLDDLLQKGQWCWTIIGAEKPRLAFQSALSIDWTKEPALGEGLTGEESTVAGALKARGASFAHQLTAVIGGKSALPVLMSLTGKGLVRADSFVPVRYLMRGETGHVKRRARFRVAAQDAGRWELARGEGEGDMETALERAFDRFGLVSRETAGGVNWAQALETLRVWELTGRVRRGYFVKGLSGAQFVRGADYARVTAALSNARGEVIWINAADPNQAWGRYLKHEEGRAFMLVPGTVVALTGGQAAMVFERGGEALRVFDAGEMERALAAFVKQFKLGRVYAERDRVTVRQYPDEAREALESAGFTREMRDYVLWR